jgi:hypothetical protein
MGLDLTAANASITLTIPGIGFTTPQRLQGFAADDVYEVPEVEPTETLMGVDGYLSGGMVYKSVIQEFMLQANSPSIPLFDAWYNYQQSGLTTYTANGTTTLPGLQKMWTTINGYLRGYKPIPQGKKLVLPQRFRIEWNLCLPQPTA